MIHDELATLRGQEVMVVMHETTSISGVLRDALLSASGEIAALIVEHSLMGRVLIRWEAVIWVRPKQQVHDR